jgi:hypothetical protein
MLGFPICTPIIYCIQVFNSLDETYNRKCVAKFQLTTEVHLAPQKRNNEEFYSPLTPKK